MQDAFAYVMSRSIRTNEDAAANLKALSKDDGSTSDLDESDAQ